jgi:hypothetical protein
MNLDRLESTATAQAEQGNSSLAKASPTSAAAAACSSLMPKQ